MDTKTRRNGERRTMVNTSRERLNGTLNRNTSSPFESPLSSKSDRSPDNYEFKEKSQHAFINDLLSCFDNDVAEQNLSKNLTIMSLRRLDKSAQHNKIDKRTSSLSPHLLSPKDNDGPRDYFTVTREYPSTREEYYPGSLIRNTTRSRKSPNVSPEALMPEMEFKIQNAVRGQHRHAAAGGQRGAETARCQRVTG